MNTPTTLTAETTHEDKPVHLDGLKARFRAKRLEAERAANAAAGLLEPAKVSWY